MSDRKRFRDHIEPSICEEFGNNVILPWEGGRCAGGTILAGKCEASSCGMTAVAKVRSRLPSSQCEKLMCQ